MRVLARLSANRMQTVARAVGIPSMSVLLVLVLAHTLTSTPAPRIGILWEAGISVSNRVVLEQRLQLVNATPIDSAAWAYDLTDTSSSNIAALLAHSWVLDTTFIDAETSSVVPNAPVGVTTTWIGDRIPLFKQRGVAKSLVVASAGLTTFAAILWLFGAGYLRDPQMLTRAIPSINAQTLGLYRIFFAFGLAFVLSELRMAEWAAPGEIHPERAWLADWGGIRWVANQPQLVTWLERFTFGAIVAFAIGLATRLSYGIIVANLTLWTLVRLQHTGTHPWGVLLVTLWCLLAVRWGDGLSLDRTIRQWWQQRPDPEATGQAYGFAVWLPGLVLGSAMAASAFAKIYSSGLNWILGGAVKYHFVTDALNAPVDWGLWVASHHWVSVGASAFAVGMEGSLIVAIFLRSTAARMAIGAGSAALLLGFYFFQAEVWWAWWLLWASFFIPWDKLSSQFFYRPWSRKRYADKAVDVLRPWADNPLSPVHYWVIFLVLALQLFASAFQIEQQPLFSNYPMYSSTYPSTASFDARASIQTPYRFLKNSSENQSDITTALEDTDLDGTLRDILLRLGEGEQLTIDERERLNWIAASFQERSGESLEVVTLVKDELAFDWSTGQLYPKTRNKVVVSLDTETLSVVE